MTCCTLGMKRDMARYPSLLKSSYGSSVIFCKKFLVVFYNKDSEMNKKIYVFMFIIHYFKIPENHCIHTYLEYVPVIHATCIPSSFKKEKYLKVLRDLRFVSVYWSIINANVSWTLHFIRTRSNLLNCSSERFPIYIVQWKGRKKQDTKERKKERIVISFSLKSINFREKMVFLIFYLCCSHYLCLDCFCSSITFLENMM